MFSERSPREMCYPVGPCFLSILYITCLCSSPTPIPFLAQLPLPWQLCLFSMYMSDFFLSHSEFGDQIKMEGNGEDGLPGGTVVKNLPANAGDAGDAGSIPGSGKSPGEGNGNPLQYSCLKNSMDRGA